MIKFKWNRIAPIVTGFNLEKGCLSMLVYPCLLVIDITPLRE